MHKYKFDYSAEANMSRYHTSMFDNYHLNKFSNIHRVTDDDVQ